MPSSPFTSHSNSFLPGNSRVFLLFFLMSFSSVSCSTDNTFQCQNGAGIWVAWLLFLLLLLLLLVWLFQVKFMTLQRNWRRKARTADTVLYFMNDVVIAEGGQNHIYKRNAVKIIIAVMVLELESFWPTNAAIIITMMMNNNRHFLAGFPQGGRQLYIRWGENETGWNEWAPLKCKGNGRSLNRVWIGSEWEQGWSCRTMKQKCTLN